MGFLLDVSRNEDPPCDDFSRNEDSLSEKSQTGEPAWHDVCNDRHRSAERRYQAT